MEFTYLRIEKNTVTSEPEIYDDIGSMTVDNIPIIILLLYIYKFLYLYKLINMYFQFRVHGFDKVLVTTFAHKESSLLD